MNRHGCNKLTIGPMLVAIVSAVLWFLSGPGSGAVAAAVGKRPAEAPAGWAAGTFPPSGAETGAVSAEAGKVKVPRYAPDRVLVRFKEGVPAKQSLQAHAAVGAQVLRTYRIVPGLELVRLPRGTSVSQALAAYRRDPRVLYAEPDYALHLEGYLVPGEPPVNDPMYGEQWSLHDGVYGGIDAPAAWAYVGQTDDEVVVAVLDTGVDVTHPDLEGCLWVNLAEANGEPGRDDDGNGVADDVYGAAFLDGGKTKTGDVRDGHGHGTHVAGIIAAATDNGLGVADVAGKAPVRILACKFMNEQGEGWTSDAISALQYVKELKLNKGVPVVAVNASWGGYRHDPLLRDAIEALQAANTNILFIAAAGNQDPSWHQWGDNDLWREYPASFDLPNIVSVAASTYEGALADFSNWGLRTVHLAAPGEQIFSTWPESAYGYMSGTSMAAAHASGVVALLASLWPGQDPPPWWKLRNALLSGAKKAQQLQEKSVTGALLSAAGAVYAAVYGEPELLAVLAPGPEVRTLTYAPVPLAALHVNGAEPAGPVTVEISKSSGGPAGSVTFTDGGVVPPDAPNDGLYWAVVSLGEPGDYQLRFTADTYAGPCPSVTAHVYDARPYVPLPTENGAGAWWRELGDGAYSLDLADDSWAEVTVPFAVYCFGQPYDKGDKLYVCDNGLISFGAPPPPGPGEASLWLPDPLPTPRLPYPVVAALWEDFDPSTGSVVYGVCTGPKGNELVIEWRNLYRNAADGPYTFQVVLGENRNDILVQYRQDDQAPQTFTGMVGVQFSPYAAAPYPGREGAQPPPAPGLAVRFVVPGDLTQDARQDDADLEEWAVRYGNPAAGWDPADLCPDGQIDLLDFAVTGFFWYRPVPTPK